MGEPEDRRQSPDENSCASPGWDCGNLGASVCFLASLDGQVRHLSLRELAYFTAKLRSSTPLPFWMLLFVMTHSETVVRPFPSSSLK
jgi:hypothetical protein